MNLLWAIKSSPPSDHEPSIHGRELLGRKRTFNSEPLDPELFHIYRRWLIFFYFFLSWPWTIPFSLKYHIQEIPFPPLNNHFLGYLLGIQQRAFKILLNTKNFKCSSHLSVVNLLQGREPFHMGHEHSCVLRSWTLLRAVNTISAS